MITVLHRGGYAQMITILQGGGAFGTPKSDYVICAWPLNRKIAIILTAKFNRIMLKEIFAEVWTPTHWNDF